MECELFLNKAVIKESPGVLSKHKKPTLRFTEHFSRLRVFLGSHLPAEVTRTLPVGGGGPRGSRPPAPFLRGTHPASQRVGCSRGLRTTGPRGGAPQRGFLPHPSFGKAFEEAVPPSRQPTGAGLSAAGP